MSFDLPHDDPRLRDVDLLDGAFRGGAGTVPLEDLLAHVERVQARLDDVSSKCAAAETQDRLLSTRIDGYREEMFRAGRLQRELLPRELPCCAGLAVSRLHVPAGHVSGDLFDVTRTSAHQVSLMLTDATGHGVEAALLSMHFRQLLRTRELAEGLGVKPNELLAILNEELLALNLVECQFITAIQAHYDELDGSLLWSRGGLPYPILIRNGRTPEHIVSAGGLLGAMADEDYELIESHLNHDDILLFYSDGLPALLLNVEGGDVADDILQTRWCRTLTARNIDQHLADIQTMIEHTSPDSWPVDDITVLALRGVGA